MSADNADFLIKFKNHPTFLAYPNGGMSQMTEMEEVTINTFANRVALHSILKHGKTFETEAEAINYLRENETSYTEYGLCEAELPFHFDDPIDSKDLGTVLDVLDSVVDDLYSIMLDFPQVNSAHAILAKIESAMYGH